jgi:hypothetical protein
MKEEYELKVIDVVETDHKDADKGTSWRIVSKNEKTGERLAHKVEKEPDVQIGMKAKVTYYTDQTKIGK